MHSGYLRDIESPQDWLYGSMRPDPIEIPSRTNLESFCGPVADQGPTFECVAYAVAGLKRYHEWKQSRSWLEFNPTALYARCKVLDGHPGANGTMPRVAMETVRTEGMAASDGSSYKIASYARQTTVSEIRQAIANEGPVVIGIRLDLAAMTALSNAELDAKQLGHISGHCMLAVGYDDRLEAFRVRNSWGEKWGDSGHFWLKYEYLEKVDPKFDAWSTLDEVSA